MCLAAPFANDAAKDRRYLLNLGSVSGALSVYERVKRQAYQRYPAVRSLGRDLRMLLTPESSAPSEESPRPRWNPTTIGARTPGRSGSLRR